MRRPHAHAQFHHEPDGFGRPPRPPGDGGRLPPGVLPGGSPHEREARTGRPGGADGLDGFEVARHLRADFGDDIVLIALSGYGRDEDRRKAKLAGFDLHYLKPIDSARLRRLLATAPAELARRRRSGELAAQDGER